MAAKWESVVPAGVIVMWHGTLANIPGGWALCDGSNGTPDLRSKFIKGAAAAQNPGATGGNLTHGHAAHGYTPQGNVAVVVASLTAAAKIGTSTASVAASTHTHPAPAFTGTVASLTHDTPNHEPPYYALAFIMRL